jgi:N-glycosylase/DNA lyase
MPVLVNSLDQLNLSLTLRAGQVFGWEQSFTGAWEGVVGDTMFILQQQEETGAVSFSYFGGSVKSDSEARTVLRDFFQLDCDLAALLSYWGARDKLFARVIPLSSRFAGLRICRQDPFECLISFIVSANNNIKRISQNLKSIRKTYGTHIRDDQYVFPSLEQFRKAKSEELRNLGLGYRAEYIVKTIALLSENGLYEQLYGLRMETDVSVARNFLTNLQGVGRKVADCVCLYSLDFASIAPVDTHMYQIACRLFSKHIKKDNYMHDIIQRAMVERFGDKAGWAHCFLFAADLRDLQKDEPKDSSENPQKRVRVRE